jgi:membrane protein
VISGGLIILFLSLVVILGPLVWKVLGPAVHSVLETRLLFGTARYLFAGVLLFGALTFLHRWLPNTRQAFARILPGVGATTVLWLLGASLFAWYVGHLTDYSAYYGSLGGVAITLVFFYISAIIFIFGAEFNAVWRERTGRQAAPQKTNGENEDAKA